MRTNLFVTVTLFLFSTTSALGQPDEGSMMIGGDLNFDMNWTHGKNASEYYNFSFNPVFGYFINERVMFGLTGSVSVYAIRSYTDWFLGAGPLFRYYIPLTETRKSQIYFGGQIQLAGHPAIHYSSDSYRKEYQVRPQVDIGFSYFIRPQIAFEASLGYQYTYASIKSGYKDEVVKSKEDRSRILFLFGIQFYLKKQGPNFASLP